MLITLSGIQGTLGKTYKAALYYEGSVTAAETKDVINNTVSFTITTPLSKVFIRVYQSDATSCYTDTPWILLDWPTEVNAYSTCYNNSNRIIATAVGGVNGNLFNNNLEFAISTTNSTVGLAWVSSDAGTGNSDHTENVTRRTFDTSTTSDGTNFYIFVRNKYFPSCTVITIQNPVVSINCLSCSIPTIGTPVITCT